MIRQGDRAQANYRRSETLPQALLLPLFDHLTVVDAGFAVQLRQGIAVLGIAIGCNDNQGRWFWQRESFEHLVEELGAGCFGSFSADIELIPILSRS